MKKLEIILKAVSLLALAYIIVCAFFAFGEVECTGATLSFYQADVEYSHEEAPGVPYTYRIPPQRLQVTTVVEGNPVRIVIYGDGMVIADCGFGPIFEDGFESGNTSGWSGGN